MIKFNKYIFLFSIYLILGTPALLNAQPKDKGLFFRHLIGSGDATFTIIPPKGNSVKYKGVSRRIALSIGHSIKPKFTLHALHALHAGIDYTNTFKFSNNQETERDKSLFGYEYFTFTVGGIYYMPWNTYISPELRRVIQGEKNRGRKSDDDFDKGDGIGYGITVGWEWLTLTSGPSLGIAVTYSEDRLQLKKVSGTTKYKYQHFGFGLTTTFK